MAAWPPTFHNGCRLGWAVWICDQPGAETGAHRGGSRDDCIACGVRGPGTTAWVDRCQRPRPSTSRIRGNHCLRACGERHRCTTAPRAHTAPIGRQRATTTSWRSSSITPPIPPSLAASRSRCRDARSRRAAALTKGLPRDRPIAVYCICGFQVSGTAVAELRRRGMRPRLSSAGSRPGMQSAARRCRSIPTYEDVP